MTFSHPLGLESRKWGYDDGCAVMQGIIRTAFPDDPPPFHITFELSDDPSGYKLKLRRFIIKTPIGRVELEPLYLTYAGTFGMCGVFRDTLYRQLM